MSDKTKKLRDEAMFARRRAAEAARKAANPDPVIRCKCGHGIYDRELYACQDNW